MTSRTTQMNSILTKNTLSRGSALAWALSVVACAAFFIGCGDGAGSAKGSVSPEELMKSDDPAQRVKGLETVGKLGAQGKKFLPKGVELLKDADKDVRTAAISLMTQVQHKTPEVLAALNAMVDGDKEIGDTALYALNELGADDAFAKGCIAALGGDNADLQSNVAMYLATSDKPLPAAQEGLAKGLAATDAGVRMSCAMALGKLSTVSDETKAALQGLLKDSDKEVVAAAKEALAKF